jgi:hypothetical protein
MKRLYLPVLVGLLLAALVPADVSAQLVNPDAPPPESVRRPYRGLFGHSDDPDTPQSLVFSASLFGAYDDNVTAGLLGRDSFDPRLQKSGAYYGANAGLAYAMSQSGQRVSYGLSSGAGASAYRFDDDKSVVPHARVAGNVTFTLGPRSSLGFNQQVVYTRYYRFLLFPSLLGTDDDGALAGDPDLELFARTALRYGSGANFSHRLSSRSSLNAGYSFGYVDYRDGEYADWESHAARIGYNRRLTAHATMNLGYGYRVSQPRVEGHRAREAHDINVGVSYSRALSFSRRTSFSFGTGSAILVQDDLTVPGSDPRTHFRLLGNASLTHEIGRSWTAQAAYNRGFVFREGFDDPFFTDAVSASVGGFVTNRLDFAALARWSFATLDRPGRNRHDSFAASAQARYALGRFVALFARYVYYQYEFDEDIPLDPDLARSLDRQGIRVGVTTSIPLIR